MTLTANIVLYNNCFECDKKDFSAPQKLRDHLRTRHEISAAAISNGIRRRNTDEFNYVKKESALPNVVHHACPSCLQHFEKIKDLKSHFDTAHLLSRSNDQVEDDLQPECSSEDAEESDLPTIVPTVNPPNLDIVSAVSNQSHLSYNNAVLQACQQPNVDDSEKIKTLVLVDTLSLQPFSISNKNSVNQYALAHQNVISNLLHDNNNIQFIPPQKRRYDDFTNSDSNLCKCSPLVASGLENLSNTSPYRKLFTERKYVELTSEICELLNKDWDFFPQIKFFSSKLFSGAILENKVNGQAVMINTIETYGRIKHVDVHRESFGKLKENVKPTSLPPPIKTMYPNVWPLSMQSTHGLKLVIGTQVSNILVTSCIRLDTRKPSSVGSYTLDFVLSSTQDSLSTKIFLDEESLQMSMAILNSPATTRLSDTHIIYQLRQLQTKILAKTAYTLCRASGPLTVRHTAQPYTIFTLSDYDTAHSSGPIIFRSIATLVLKKGKDAYLSKDFVQKLEDTATGSIKGILQAIVSLFSPDGTTLPILGNDRLNKFLEQLVKLLMPSISLANSSVQKEIDLIFENYL